MAGDDQEKTLPPSERKLARARARGEVFTVPEARHALMLGAMLAGLAGLGPVLAGRMTVALTRIWAEAGTTRLTVADAQPQLARLLGQVAAPLLPMLALLVTAAMLTALPQGGGRIAWARVQPKWSRISPLAGLRRMLGLAALGNLAKTLAKLTMILALCVLTVRPHLAALDTLVGAGADAFARTAATLATALIGTVALAVGALALVDLIVQRRAWLKRMGMSRQEVKEEHRESEGDPLIKRRIRTIALRRARQRMMAAVPTASVVVTNPTHYAVALRYDHGAMSAPLVVAKGTDAVAMNIRQLAAAHGVPVVESPPLARALHAAVEIDRPIPTQHYRAVAEIISYVMRLAEQRGRA